MARASARSFSPGSIPRSLSEYPFLPTYVSPVTNAQSDDLRLPSSFEKD